MVALLLVPFFVGLAVLVLYRQNGKRQVMRMDLVQFIYSFLVFPVLFIWGKSFIFYLMRYDAVRGLSYGQMFIVDTVFSTIFLYLYAFLIMHSLTKTFNLRWFRDPLYDMFSHSEYFHLWFTHVAMSTIAVTLLIGISVLNLWLPFHFSWSAISMGLVLGLGGLFGLIFFFMIWLSDPQQGQFLRIVKIQFALALVVHVLLYFFCTPSLHPRYSIFWLILMIFVSATVCSFLFERSTKAKRVANWFKHADWERQKIYLFGQKKGQAWRNK